MQPSRHNILFRLAGSDAWAIVNPLHGSADLLEAGEAEAFRAGRWHDPEGLAARGYLVEPAVEAALFRTRYLEFLERREQEEVQAFFVPTYACDFGCGYCYQAGYDAGSGRWTPEVTDAFLAYLDRAFAGRPHYITLFGGEPLLPAADHRHNLARLVDGAAARGIDLALVTNGYRLAESLELLGRASIREIQVTLDGVGERHDRRRPLRSGGPTFERIVAGIEAALAAGHTLNLRVVVDRENLDGLPGLARFAIERGWTAGPHFKTQLGRNYELHRCGPAPEQLYSRLELHQALARLIGRHPEVLEFHRPAFSLSRFLFDEGRLPDPLFDACPGAKSEWAFDHTGRIYACTATVGNRGDELGTFFPEVRLDHERVAGWQARDVLSIAECRSCPSALACGGGCAAVARTRGGSLDGPDCRPVADIMGLGFPLYLPKEDG